MKHRAAGEAVYAPQVGGPVGWVLAGTRVIGLVLLCVLTAAVYAAGRLLVEMFQGPAPAWRRRCMRVWGGMTCRLIGLKLDRTGLPPECPSIIVSNHVSYVDIPLLAAWTGARFVSKHEVSGWPLIGGLARLGGTLFVTRGSARDVAAVQGQIRRAVHAGDRVVIFPEGTSTCGERVLPFRSALLAGAAADGTGVHYATLAYAVADDLPDASLAVAWTGSQSLIPHLWRLLCLPAFEARLVFGPDALRDSNRRTLAARLHARVADQHRRIVSAQRPWEAAPARVG